MRLPLHALGFGSVVAGIALVGALSAVQAQELQTINVITPNESSCGPYPQFAAEDFGFWAKEGIKVNRLSSNTQVPYVSFLQNGDADVIIVDSGAVLQAVDAGLPVKVVYEAFNYSPDEISVLADSPAKSLADLKGKTIGLASDRDQLTALISLKTVGIDISEVKTVVVGESAPVIVKALQDGTIQAYAGGPVERLSILNGGIQLINLTPPEVSNVPGNSLVVWAPTMEEKRPLIQAFLNAWAKSQLSGALDTKAVMSACKKRVPEQWEKPGNGERIVNNSVYNTQLRRTVKLGEERPKVWTRIQVPYVELKEISRQIDPAEFLDSSFIDAANNFTTDDVMAGIEKFRSENADILIP
jgi:NitT/TauT family transport system substrate-binding protein